MKHRIEMEIPNLKTIPLELDDELAPKTVKKLMDSLPIKVSINKWGEELYTDKTSIDTGPENAKETVDLYDVAYWPQGKGICVFYGPTPIGKQGEIRPISEVNVIGKTLDENKEFLSKMDDGTQVTFKKT